MLRLNRERTVGMVALGLFAVGPMPAFGQAIGMLQDERAVTACSPGYEDYRNGTGVIYGGATPQTTPINYSYSYTGGSPDSASVSQSVYGNFGRLSLNTSGSAQSGGGNGAFTWSSTYWGGDVVVGFSDNIIANEDMNVYFQYTVTGQSSFQGNSDGGTYANVTTDCQFGSFGHGLDDFSLNGTTTYSGVVHLYPGVLNSTYLFAGLGWDCSANSNDGAPRYSSYQMSAVGNVSITSLTPGATFYSQSGFDYSAVPEPSSLWILGLGALGLLRRKRR